MPGHSTVSSHLSSEPHSAPGGREAGSCSLLVPEKGSERPRQWSEALSQSLSYLVKFRMQSHIDSVSS